MRYERSLIGMKAADSHYLIDTFARTLKDIGTWGHATQLAGWTTFASAAVDTRSATDGRATTASRLTEGMDLTGKTIGWFAGSRVRVAANLTRWAADDATRLTTRAADTVGTAGANIVVAAATNSIATFCKGGATATAANTERRFTANTV